MGKEDIVLKYDVCNDGWEDASKVISGVSSLSS